MSDGSLDALETEVERLTVQAVQAAERGDWDTVESCVDRRGTLFPIAALSISVRDRVVTMDGRLAELAAHAKAAISVLLMETGQTRRRLEQLKEGHAGSEARSAPVISMRA